jgi:hypothetical protein
VATPVNTDVLRGMSSGEHIVRTPPLTGCLYNSSNIVHGPYSGVCCENYIWNDNDTC